MSTASSETEAWTEAEAQTYVAVSSSGRAWSEDPARVPWSLALTVARQDRPHARLILDVASGPGGFLGFALDSFPEANGIWMDPSETMRKSAMANLAEFEPRIAYVLGDFSQVATASGSGQVDLITSARATHHLLLSHLDEYYAACFALLAPGGWFANHDIMLPTPEWERRLRDADTAIRGSKLVPGHAHPNPMPTYPEHLAAIARAGFSDVQEVWRTGITSLVMARKPG